MNIEDEIDRLVTETMGRVHRQIEEFLIQNHADPATHILLTFDIPPRRKLLVLVPTEVAEDVQALPPAELMARYPHRELVFP